MPVRSRFASNLFVLVAGGLLVLIRFAFDPVTTGWLALGLATACVIVIGLAFLVRGRGPAQRALDVPAALIGGWGVVSSRTFDAQTVGWLALAAGAALALLAAVGLCLHEARMERAVAPAALTPEGNGAVPAGTVIADPAPTGLRRGPS